MAQFGNTLSAGMPSSKQQIIDNHLKLLEERKCQLRSKDKRNDPPPDNAGRHAKSDRKVETIVPIYISDLILDSEHHGRIFRGKFIAPSYAISKGVVSILEDEKGDVIKLVVFTGLRGFDLSDEEQMKFAFERLKVGSWVTVDEPYFRKFLDGSVGLQIDNQNDLKFIEYPEWRPASTANQFKARAEREILSKDYDTAYRTFGAALLNVDCGGIYVTEEKRITSLLFNVGSTHLKLQRLANSQNSQDARIHGGMHYLYYLSASIMNPFYKKAIDRTAEYLVSVGIFGATAEVIYQSNMFIFCFDKLLAQHVKLSSNSGNGPVPIKEKGNELYLKGEYEEALKIYLGAIYNLNKKKNVSYLLSGRAVAALKMNHIYEVLMDSIIALILDMKNADAFYLLCESLYLLRIFKHGKILLRHGLSFFPTDHRLIGLRPKFRL